MKLMLVHPLFSEYGGAEKVLLDMFRTARKKYKTEMYTLFYKDYLKNEDNIFYGSLEEPKLKKIFGYKVNPFNKKAIKHLGKQLALRASKDDKIILTNFPATLVLNEALKHNSELAEADTTFLSFEPDRILYYEPLRNLDYIPEDIRSYKFQTYSKFLNRWRHIDWNIVRNRANRIITLSDYVTKQTKQIYKIKNTKTDLIMYVDTSNFKPISKTRARTELNKKYKLNLTNNDHVIFSIARLVKSKGHDELLNALNQLPKEELQNTKVLIGGKGPLTKHLQNRINKENLPVTLIGFVPDEDLAKFYSCANTFITLPRKETGGPLTILEGIYADNFIISTNEGGPPELITKRNGILVNPDNSKEIAQAILKAKKQKPRAKERRALINKKHSFKNYFKRFEKSLKLI
ncbi:MAG: glycosyltransferase family 4 protein [Candidatus Nanoarchaeia archaeon]|jgi:glycosyltransferase involved in cell wall biosynthesis|nr:glycosyltransferase family 4 protein [Candidatus Nanoarchaeia archaeon]|tara:strand:+ start:876 stop:2090 length:1215 start_codon:yes stop_codon:yes gene_type:complete